MAFSQGHKKVGGRKKGTPNRITKELREDLKSLVFTEIDNLPNLLNTLEPEKKIEVLFKLMPIYSQKLKASIKMMENLLDLIF